MRPGGRESLGVHILGGRKAPKDPDARQPDLVGVGQRRGSSQLRVAKMLAGRPSVSLVLLVHGLLVAGATRPDIAGVIRKAALPSA